jgi:hypothetical protein
LYKNCGWWKKFDCIFGFSVKSYVRHTINLSWNKILLTSVIVYYGVCDIGSQNRILELTRGSWDIKWLAACRYCSFMFAVLIPPSNLANFRVLSLKVMTSVLPFKSIWNPWRCTIQQNTPTILSKQTSIHIEKCFFAGTSDRLGRRITNCSQDISVGVVTRQHTMRPRNCGSILDRARGCLYHKSPGWLSYSLGNKPLFPRGLNGHGVKLAS